MDKLVTLVLLVVLIFVSCGYTPPENHQFLLEMHGSIYFPVWSPSGRIYFLVELGDLTEAMGSLWVCDTLGKNVHQLLPGHYFGYLAISNDGSKLTLTCGEVFEGGPLIITDSVGSSIDTIPTSEPKVVSAKFSYDGSKIYYYAWGGDSNGFYRANIDGTDEEFLQGGRNYPVFFDITPGGRIIKISEETVCALSPNDSTIVCWAHFPVSEWGRYELHMRYLTTQTDSVLNVKPYKSSEASFPYWAPHGNKIIFTATERGGFEGTWGGWNLWILDLTK